MPTTAARLETSVTALLNLLDDAQRAQARLPFDGGGGAGDERRQWSYLPGVRRGLALHEMGREQAQAALRLVAAALQPHAFAALAAVLALEDVLDLAEGGSGRRHRGDYWVVVYGEPGPTPGAGGSRATTSRSTSASCAARCARCRCSSARTRRS